jgi:hypothetical protein
MSDDGDTTTVLSIIGSDFPVNGRRSCLQEFEFEIELDTRPPVQMLKTMSD